MLRWRSCVLVTSFPCGSIHLSQLVHQYKLVVISYSILFIQVLLFFPISFSHSRISCRISYSIQSSQLLRLSFPVTVFQMSLIFYVFNCSEDHHSGMLQNAHQSGLSHWRWKAPEAKARSHHVAVRDTGYLHDVTGFLTLILTGLKGSYHVSPQVILHCLLSSVMNVWKKVMDR